MAAAAARQLLQTRELFLSRALETAAVVCHMRPYSDSNTLGAVPAKWRPAGDTGKRLHSTMRTARNTTYAHTDQVLYRRAVNTRAMIGRRDASARRNAEEWHPLERGLLPILIPFFENCADEFHLAKEEAEGRLAALIP